MKIFYTLVLTLMIALSSCTTVEKIEKNFEPSYVSQTTHYYPGYYQSKREYGGYMREGYYDYVGNYHPRYTTPEYEQDGRFVHGFVIAQDVTIKNYESY